MSRTSLPEGHRVVSVPMSAAEVRPGRRGDQTGYLTHAAEMDARGDLVRVLCGRVKLHHLLHDGALYNVHGVECAVCTRRATPYLGSEYEGHALVIAPLWLWYISASERFTSQGDNEHDAFLRLPEDKRVRVPFAEFCVQLRDGARPDASYLELLGLRARARKFGR